MSERRSRLLEAARRLFHQYGPNKTTVADIAQAAGVGVGTVYLEFPNKDAILLALSESGHRSVLTAIERAWAEPGPAPVRLRRALEARLDAFLELAETSIHGRDLLHCGTCDPILRAHRAFRAAERQLFAGFVAAGAAEGGFCRDDSEETARALLIAYSAFSPPAVFVGKAEQLRRDISLVHDLVFSGLLAR
jgi:AcrR family transcriptional regulator